MTRLPIPFFSSPSSCNSPRRLQHMRTAHTRRHPHLAPLRRPPRPHPPPLRPTSSTHTPSLFCVMPTLTRRRRLAQAMPRRATPAGNERTKEVITALKSAGISRTAIAVPHSAHRLLPPRLPRSSNSLRNGRSFTPRRGPPRHPRASPGSPDRRHLPGPNRQAGPDHPPRPPPLGHPLHHGGVWLSQ